MVRTPRIRISAIAITLAGVMALTLNACAFGPPDEKTSGGQAPKLPKPTTSPKPPADEGVGVQPLATGLEVPWGITFVSDGALVTERGGRLLKVTAGGEVSEVQRINDVHADGEGGLLGIVASPNFAADNTVFIYYTTAADNRIAKLQPGKEPQPILTGINKASNHNGGALAFGPDGLLYAGVGDAENPDDAQDTGKLNGKILRMTPDGAPAPGNPFPDSVVYSYGHRNVQGLTWDSGGRLLATEFGQDTWDEVNIITAGGNYGWPETEGQAGQEGRIDPIIVWSPDDASPSGAAIVDNVLIVAALKGQRLWVAQLGDDGKPTAEPTPLLQDQYGRLRTVVSAPDGSLWIATSNRDGRGTPAADDDRIIRIVPPGGSAVELL